MLPFQSSVMPFQAAAVAVQGTLQRAAPSSVTSPGPDCVIDQRHTDWLTIGLLSLLRLLRLLSLLSLLSLLGLLSLVAPDLCKLRGEFTLFPVTPSHVARPRLRHQSSFRRIGERGCARSLVGRGRPVAYCALTLSAVRLTSHLRTHQVAMSEGEPVSSWAPYFLSITPHAILRHGLGIWIPCTYRCGMTALWGKVPSRASCCAGVW